MSWFDDCPLTRNDFEVLFAYLILTNDLFPQMKQAERIKEISQKLLKWLADD